MERHNKVAIVTGAGTGLGHAISTRLVREGASVVAVGRRMDPLNQLALSLDAGRVLPLQADIGDVDNHQHILDSAIEHFGCVDIVINNAAVGYLGSVDQITVREIEESLRVNTLGPICFSRLMASYFLARSEPSLLVNVTSLSALAAAPYQSAYSASKAALAAFSEALRRETRNTNMRVLTVFPGAFDSEMNSEQARAMLATKYKVEVATADQIAGMVLKAIDRDSDRLIAGNFGEKLIGRVATLAPRALDMMLPMFEDHMRLLADGSRSIAPPPAKH